MHLICWGPRASYSDTVARVSRGPLLAWALLAWARPGGRVCGAAGQALLCRTTASQPSSNCHLIMIIRRDER